MSLISSESIQQINHALSARQAEMEELIQKLVELESPSGDESGCRAVVEALVSGLNVLIVLPQLKR